mgnify:CR=1 FL=1
MSTAAVNVENKLFQNRYLVDAGQAGLNCAVGIYGGQVRRLGKLSSKLSGLVGFRTVQRADAGVFCRLRVARQELEGQPAEDVIHDGFAYEPFVYTPFVTVPALPVILCVKVTPEFALLLTYAVVANAVFEAVVSTVIPVATPVNDAPANAAFLDSKS